MGCYIWYSEVGTGRDRRLPSPLLAVPNVTAHPLTASVPTTVLLYSGPLLCGFNVPIEGLTFLRQANPVSISCAIPSAFSVVLAEGAILEPIVARVRRLCRSDSECRK